MCDMCGPEVISKVRENLGVDEDINYGRRDPGYGGLSVMGWQDYAHGKLWFGVGKHLSHGVT